jgi:hypothetical protein
MQHRLQSDLENFTMKSTGQVFKSAEGYAFGWGTTVGNGIQGWAPSAVFIDTDAGAGVRVYTNTGTKTTASWDTLTESELADGFSVTSNGIIMNDSVGLIFGSGQDINFNWDATFLTCGPTTGLWSGCPSQADPDPRGQIVLFDDFLTGVDTGTNWISVDDGGTGTNTHGDQLGGSLNVVTAAADNDYHAMESTAECFDLAGARELWFEARFRLAEANTNESAWWFGLTNTNTTGGIQANNAGPLASYDGILMWKDEGTMTIDGETSNAGTQDTEAEIATFVTNTWTRVGFHVSAAATTGVCTFYYNVSDATYSPNGMVAHGTTANITRAGMEPMHVIFGVKAGPSGGAETLQVDYVKCVQTR